MVMVPTPLPPAPVERFSWDEVTGLYLASACDSKHTRRAYGRWLRVAGQVLGVGHVDDLTGAELAEFRSWVLQGLAGKAASQEQALAALRSFLAWARVHGAHQLPGDLVAQELRTTGGHSAKPLDVLTEAEIPRFLAAAETARDAALLVVMLGGGLRVGETVGLDVSDVRADQAGGGLLYIRQGKGRRDRSVPVHDEVVDAVRAYLAESGRMMGVAGPLFRPHDRGARARGGARGRRLTEKSVWHIVQECRRRAGILGKSITPHSLRHTYALRTLKASKNVVAVQALLGHASLATTQTYVRHLDLTDLRHAVPALPEPR